MALLKSHVRSQVNEIVLRNGKPNRSPFRICVAPTPNHPIKSLKMIDLRANVIREEVKRGEYRFRSIPGCDAIIGSSMTTTTGADEDMIPESPSPSASHINDLVVEASRQAESAVQILLIGAALTRCDDAVNRFVFHSLFSVVSMYLSTHDVPSGLHFF